MAFCVECGTKLPDGSRFCSNCGKAVVVSAPSVEETTVVEETPFVDETPVSEDTVIESTEVISEENFMEENAYAGVYDPVSEVETTEPVVVTEESFAETEVLISEDEDFATAENIQENIPAEPVETVIASAVPAPNQQAGASSGTKEEQQALLDNIYARLKNERLCWKIFGFVWLGYAALFTILGFVFPAFFIHVALMWVPLAVISFKMIGKVDYYMNTLYTDCGPAVERCGSVGMIVFGAFFNTVAMIFIILNFVNVKSNEKVLKDIKHNQDVYNNRI